MIKTDRKMKTQNITIENLTKIQTELFNSLVQMGDSKELALETVLDIRFNPELKISSKMYQTAYYS